MQLLDLLPEISRMLLFLKLKLVFATYFSTINSTMRNYIFTLLTLTFLSCQNDSGALSLVYSLPKKQKEVSGIIYLDSINLLWTLEDSGNANEIYGLNFENGSIEKTLTIENTANVDWEDITKDKYGNIYIGDFGNNDNERKDLCIYKIDKKSLTSRSAIPAYQVSFAYPEQNDFPPKKTEMFYDVEGFFEYKNNFYLFTKNRSKDFDGTAFIYKIPNTPGFHQAVLMGEFKTCDNYNHCAITAATIAPDASKVVILTHDKIFLFENFEGDDFLNGKKTTLELNHFSQKEAVSFIDNDRLFIADEKNKSEGGNVYMVSIKKLKSKS